MQAEYAPIPALERAAQVLQVVLESPSGLPAKHIAAACPAVPKTSFYRLLSALVASGFLMFDAQRSVYCAGELFTRAYESQDQRLQVLLRVAQPHLEQLAQAARETVKLNVLSRDMCCVMRTVPGPQRIRITVDEGTNYPLHTGAAGKILLAAQGAGAVHRYFAGPVKRYTPHTLVTEQEFWQAMAVIEKQGYAVDPGEYIPEIGAVACPVYDAHGRVAAAVSIAYPNQLRGPAAVRQLAALLVAATAAISQEFQKEYI